ncbi:mitochondrial genome maintenance MGM101 [Sparassis latifolia]
MASRVLLGRFSTARASSWRTLTPSRTYVAVARTFTPRAASATKGASTKTALQAAKASTTSLPSSAVLSQPPSPTPFPSEASELSDALSNGVVGETTSTDWSKSYYGLSRQPFSKDVSEVLLSPIDPQDVEMKPVLDGLIYLPEIKYRRVLNKAFGPGGWGLAPRSETNVGPKVVSREYALVCLGRLVAIARGEQEYFDPSGIPTATEACKSNALMRCCKDLGVASELWDPRFIREFKQKYCVEVFAENLVTKKKRKLWRRKDQPKFDYPWKE